MKIGKRLINALCSFLAVAIALLPLSAASAADADTASEAGSGEPRAADARYEANEGTQDDSTANVDQGSDLTLNQKKRVIYTPAPKGSKITIVGDDIHVKAGTEGFSILDGVTARVSTGDNAYVWVVDSDGFSIDIPGVYYVVYAAMKSEGLAYHKRTITVTGTRDRATYYNPEEARFIERYERFVQFINTKGDDLSRIMKSIEVQYVKTMQKDRLNENESKNNGITPALDVGTHNTSIKITNWPEIIATFIAGKSAGVINPYNLDFLRSLPYEELESVFWDMNSVTTLQVGDESNTVVKAKSPLDAAEEYGFSRRQLRVQKELLRPEFLRAYATILGITSRSTYQTDDAELLMLQFGLPQSGTRQKAIQFASSLTGRVTYLWGGKYNNLGEKPEWSEPQKTSAAAAPGDNAETKNTGLDCSGYVAWVLLNACGDESLLDVIGFSSSSQWWHSSPVDWNDGQPGDLVFYAAPTDADTNHVGIIIAKDTDGSYLVAHCSWKDDGVIITDAWSRGFRIIRRPILYDIIDALPGSADTADD